MLTLTPRLPSIRLCVAASSWFACLRVCAFAVQRAAVPLLQPSEAEMEDASGMSGFMVPFNNNHSQSSGQPSFGTVQQLGTLMQQSAMTSYAMGGMLQQMGRRPPGRPTGS